ncbi:hypothetical protein L6164_037825 [Bauhinia variegata]|uniref:Uncharacterized protein n=1 Tax=Bauhinia variegata TaxID=167791 RepID=A0ACB9KLD4_BAUVA|nr:hypothetical protein L6164_037825 [Bauhinia variegata]
MTTASSCCEGLARNQPPHTPDQVPVVSLVGPLRLGALSLSSYQPPGARPVLLFQTRTTLNVREDKGRPPERTDRGDLTYSNRTIAA